MDAPKLFDRLGSRLEGRSPEAAPSEPASAVLLVCRRVELAERPGEMSFDGTPTVVEVGAFFALRDVVGREPSARELGAFAAQREALDAVERAMRSPALAGHRFACGECETPIKLLDAWVPTPALVARVARLSPLDADRRDVQALCDAEVFDPLAKLWSARRSAAFDCQGVLDPRELIRARVDPEFGPIARGRRALLPLLERAAIEGVISTPTRKGPSRGL